MPSGLPQQSMHFPRREMTSRANRVIAVDFAVNREAAFSAHDMITQINGQFTESGHLGRCRPFIFKITDHTNADTDLINRMVTDMAAIDLVEPATTDLDFTIAGILAVTDHEMVGQSVFHPATAMGTVINCRITAVNTAVMANDDLPAVAWNAQPVGRRHDIVNITITSSASGNTGNKQTLTNHDRITT